MVNKTYKGPVALAFWILINKKVDGAFLGMSRFFPGGPNLSTLGPNNATTKLDALGYKMEFVNFDPKDKNVSKEEYNATLKISKN